MQAGTFTKVKIAGRGNVPADAVGVELNVTPIENEGRGFATLYPCTATRPTASTLNYTPGVNIANATIVALNTTGEVCIYTHATSHYALDVVAHLQRYQEPGSRVDYPTGDSPYWVASDGTNIWIATRRRPPVAPGWGAAPLWPRPRPLRAPRALPLWCRPLVPGSLFGCAGGSPCPSSRPLDRRQSARTRRRKMNPADGARVDYPTGGNPYWVASDGTKIWIANFKSDTVSKMNPG